MNPTIAPGSSHEVPRLQLVTLYQLLPSLLLLGGKLNMMCVGLKGT